MTGLVGPTAAYAHIEGLCAWNTHVPTEDIIVKHALVIAEIQITESGIPDAMVARVQIGHRARARFLRPELPLILPKKVIIIGFIHDEGNLRCAGWTFRFKGGHFDIWIITENPRHHIGTSLRSLLREPVISRRRPWLMKRGVAKLLSAAFGNLFRIIDIHCIGETVVCILDLGVIIPNRWLIAWFPTRKRRTARAAAHMCDTECLSRKRRALTATRALTLLLFPRPFYFARFGLDLPPLERLQLHLLETEEVAPEQRV